MRNILVSLCLIVSLVCCGITFAEESVTILNVELVESDKLIDWGISVHENWNINTDSGKFSEGQALDFASIADIFYGQISRIAEKREEGKFDFWTVGVSIDAKEGLQWLAEKSDVKVVWHLGAIIPRVHINYGWEINGDKPISEWERHLFIGGAIFSIKL